MKTIQDNLGRSIYIIDDAFTTAQHEHFFTTVKNSFYRIGFQDTEAVERLTNKYLHSAWSLDDYANCGLKNAIESLEIYNKLKDCSLDRVTINLSTPSDTYFPHTHHNQYSLLYYLNLDWKPEWAGETMFYNDDLTEVIYTSLYKPKRLILLDGGIPHSIKVQSQLAPHYRFTLAMFFDK
jgi:hypothetical protein